MTASRGESECGMCMAIRIFTSQTGSTHLLTGYEDGSVALWDASSWKEVRTEETRAVLMAQWLQTIHSVK